MPAMEPLAFSLNGSFSVPAPVDLSAIALGGLQAAVLGTHLVDENHDIDIVGVLALGIGVGVGGGILRDVLLAQLPVALTAPSYLLTALAATGFGSVFSRWISRLTPVLQVLDAATLGLFMAIGVIKAAGSGLGVLPTVFVGVVAATGGGIIRDLLLRVPVSVMQTGSLYVVAAVGGAAVYELLHPFAADGLAATAAIVVTFTVRLLSMRFGWTTPTPHALRLPPAVIDRIEDPVKRAARRARPGGQRGGPEQDS